MKWTKGVSLSLFYKIDEDTLSELSGLGIKAVELSFNERYYINELFFLNKARYYVDLANKYDIKIWSIHLPYCSYGKIETRLDLSSLDKTISNRTVAVYKELIKAAGAAGIEIAIVHASMDPVNPIERNERLKVCKENLKELSLYAHEFNIKLAIENLPRTCLGNCASELIDIVLSIPNLKVCFDTNHSLIDNNVYFLNELYRNNIDVFTLHISDYDFKNEMHLLPGDGHNDFQAIVNVLNENNYSGPLMYEIRNRLSNYNINYEDISNNQDWFINKFIK